MSKNRLGVVACLALAALLSSLPASAQRASATLRGTVTDVSKSVVPGATVVVTNEETGLTRTGVTNESGAYAFTDLPIGQYQLAVELAGFKTETRTGIRLRVADDYLVDVVLQTGDISEVITVAASSTPVKMLGGDVSGVITGQQVRELPLNGRNFLQLATLMPGVSVPDSLNMKDKGLTSGSDMSVSGGDVTANLWTVDGANNNDVGSNRTIIVYPSMEAIEEFKVMRNNYGPEFGGAGGAQINIVTRGGTNQFRGSAFYSFRNDAFNAKNYFLEQTDQPKDQLSRNDFGGTFGGPIIKDRFHFFGSVEYNKEDRGTTRVAFVPTQAERNGDFSGASIPNCTLAPPNDPLTGAPFAGNRIPSDRLSPAGQAYLNLYPLPNVTPAANSCNNWVGSIESPIDYSQYNVRADWTFTDRTRLMVRYTQDSWKNGAPSLYANLWGDDAFPAVDSNWDQPSRSFAASLNQTFGSTATNSIQFSYAANKIEITRGGLDTGVHDRINSTLVPLYGYDAKQYGADVGHPVWWGGAGYQALWNEAPFLNNQDLFVVKDDYTQVFGNHLVKAGVLASFGIKNEDTDGNGSSQHSRFWGSAGLNGWGANTGNILADFLLRDMTFGFSEASAGRSAQQRWRDLEFYIADSWQVSPRFTLDYGLRYSMFFNPYTTDDKIMSFVPELYNPAISSPCNGLLQPPDQSWCQDAGYQGSTPGPNRSLMEQDFGNFAPRVGFAYDVFGNGKTAVRGGIGQFFQRERLSPLLGMATNPPFITVLNGLRKLDSTTEPCGGCFGTGNAAVTIGREVDFVTPHSWQWNLMFQHEVWRNTTLEVGYVANYGYDLLRSYDVNQVPSGDSNGNGVSDRLDYVRSNPADGSLRLYGGLRGDNPITLFDHSGESTYHSLQTQFISRFGRGSQVQASYTLARSRANFNLTDSSASVQVGTAHADNEDTGLDWGRPDVGRSHIFNASVIWMLPSLEGESAVKRGFLGDWELAAIVGAASGQPFTAYTGSLPGISGGPSGVGGGNNPQYPIRTGESCSPSGDLDEQIINPAAYTLAGYQLGTIGTARRGDCTGPGYFQTDVSFAKNFRLSDRLRFQFRWDVFNIFNNTNFLFAGMNNSLSPSSVVYDAPRTSATEIVSYTPAGNFGQATRTRDARQMQFQFRLLW